MMDRRQFLRRASLVAAGVVAADQLDVLEMLAPRRLFAGADFGGYVIPSSVPLVSTHIPDGGYERIMSTPAPLWVPNTKAWLAQNPTGFVVPTVRS